MKAHPLTTVKPSGNKPVHPVLERLCQRLCFCFTGRAAPPTKHHRDHHHTCAFFELP